MHYLLVPAGSAVADGPGLQRQIDRLDGRALAAASEGQGGTRIEAWAVACGQLPVIRAHTNFTLTIATANSSMECQQQAALAAAGGPAVSCSRCPQLRPLTPYTLLLAPRNQRAGAVVALPVSTAPPWVVRPPSFIGSPSASAPGESTLQIDFTADGVGKVNYAVVYDSVYARFMDTYVVFDNQVRWAGARGWLGGDGTARRLPKGWCRGCRGGGGTWIHSQSTMNMY